jgi:CRP-like cAMP-binding protein
MQEDDMGRIMDETALAPGAWSKAARGAPPHTVRIQAFLANTPLLAELGAAELDRIAAATRQLRVAKGDVLFNRGDASEGFYIVVFGQVKLAFVSPSGDEKVVEIVGPNQSFGEAVLFMERPHVVTAQALADSLVLHVSKATMFDEFEHEPRFARRVVAGLSKRLHQLLGDLEAYSMRSGTERVIGFLLRDCASEQNEGNSYTLTFPTTKGVVASKLNLTQEHFSRILHDLSADGLIEVDGRRVRVPDLERLRRYAG